MVFAVSLSRSTNSVAVIGGGVVGAAVAYTLARRGLAPVLLEAEDALALGASGTNSGILHTGFDSVPGALETQLILRSAALRDAVLDELGVPALRCGAVLRPGTDEQADNARRNGVAVGAARRRARGPGRDGDRPRRLHARAGRRRTAGRGRDPHRRPRGGHRARERGACGWAATSSCDVAVNCAGLGADAVARLVGDESFTIYPRKGEFFVFDATLDRILLPVPPSAPRGCSCSPPSTARSSPAPPHTTSPTRRTGRCGPRPVPKCSTRPRRCCPRWTAPSPSPATPACARRARTAPTT